MRGSMTDASRKHRILEGTVRGGLGRSKDEVGRLEEEFRLRWSAVNNRILVRITWRRCHRRSRIRTTSST